MTMTSERAFLIAPVEALLIAEPTVESRKITDEDLVDVAQTIVDASSDLVGYEINLERANGIIGELLAGSNGEPRRDAWRGIWEGDGPPVALLLCTTWRGMPYIATAATRARWCARRRRSSGRKATPMSASRSTREAPRCTCSTNSDSRRCSPQRRSMDCV
jgi:hypothetical protein